jgi:hypothetical protein
MSQPDYTLEWILPFVRQALKGVSNLDFSHYMQALWMRLEKFSSRTRQAISSASSANSCSSMPSNAGLIRTEREERYGSAERTHRTRTGHCR